MRVGHDVTNAREFNTDDPVRLINMALELADHPGIAQFRVGIVSTGVLDTAVPVTFSSAFSDSNYQVFLQTDTNVSVVVYPTNLTEAGFTLNLSVGVIGTFSYLAVGII